MFYSHEVLTSRKHGVATVWLIATLGSRSGLKKITRRAILQVDITKACETIAEPDVPMALRLQSNLMYGVSKVYAQQCNYVLLDAQNIQLGMRALFKRSKAAELDPDAGKARPSQLVVEDDPAFLPDAFSPIFDFDPSGLRLMESPNWNLSSVSRQNSGLSRMEHATASSLNLSIPTDNSDELGGFVIPNSRLGTDDANTVAAQEGDADGFDPDVMFEFDIEGNILDNAGLGATSTQKLLPQDRLLDSATRNRDSASPEHTMEPAPEDVNVLQEWTPLKSHWAGPLSDAVPFPSAGSRRSESLQPGKSTSAVMISRQTQDTRYRRNIPVDKCQQIRNSELAKWNAMYVANMMIARNQKRLHKTARQAKNYAKQAIFGYRVSSIEPFNTMLKLASSLSIFTNDIMLSHLASASNKRHITIDEYQDEPNKKRRLSISSRVGRGASDQIEVSDISNPVDYEQEIEIGREGRPQIDDHSSQMPWNVALSQVGSGQGSRPSSMLRFHGQAAYTVGQHLQPGSLVKNSRVSSAIPFSPPLGSRRPRQDTSINDPLSAPGNDSSPSAGADDLTTIDLVRNDYTQPEFEFIGPAIDVDTQTAATSQWVRETLSVESSNFLNYVRSQLEQNEDLVTEDIEFGALLPQNSHTRTVAAQAFMHLLSLSSRSLLNVEQISAFGSIKIKVPR